MSDLALLSRQLDASERTLRRAVEDGMLRADRLSERRLRVSVAEQRYLRRRWPLLSGLRRALRTEPNVRLAVLFGSVARGEETEDSDVDILVDLHDPERFRMLELQERLSQAVGRDVQLLRIGDAERDPAIFGEALAEGRVILDRDGQWEGLSARAGNFQRQGAEELQARARSAIERARRNAGA